jgi:hypothetical protein
MMRECFECGHSEMDDRREQALKDSLRKIVTEYRKDDSCFEVSLGLSNAINEAEQFLKRLGIIVQK